MNREHKAFFDTVHKDEAFQAILNQIEMNHESKVRRIVRTAWKDSQFFCTIILSNYELLEVTITAGRLGHMAALECDVEVY